VDSAGHSIWRLIAAPAGAPSTPAFAVVVPIFDSWINLSPASWISPSAGCGVNNPGCPTGLYTYETCWCQCLPGTDGSVSLDIAADNEAIVLFNNVIAPGGGAIPTPTPPGTEFKGTAHVAFVYGASLTKNCLQVQVENFDVGSATAMVLSGTVTGIGALSGGECAAESTITPSMPTTTPTPTRTRTRTPTTDIINPT
jgi:hypothetical protein